MQRRYRSVLYRILVGSTVLGARHDWIWEEPNIWYVFVKDIFCYELSSLLPEKHTIIQRHVARVLQMCKLSVKCSVLFRIMHFLEYGGYWTVPGLPERPDNAAEHRVVLRRDRIGGCVPKFDRPLLHLESAGSTPQLRLHIHVQFSSSGSSDRFRLRLYFFK